MKFCVNCTHFASRGRDCLRRHEPEVDLVTGQPMYRVGSPAQYERTHEGDEWCGKDAKFFEPKPKEATSA